MLSVVLTRDNRSVCFFQAVRFRRAAIAALVACVALGALPAQGQSRTDTKSVPIVVERDSSGDVIAVFAHVSINGRQYVFKVDTGATESAISTSIARADRLPATGHAESFSTLGCQASGQPVRVTNWKVGAVSLPPTVVVAQTGLVHGEVDGEPFGGLLGSDVLSRFSSVNFDFADNRLILNAGRIRGGRGIAMSTNHRRSGATYETVALRLDGKVGTWIVDTGSPFTLISALTDKRDRLRSLGSAVLVRSAASCLSHVKPVALNGWSSGQMQLPATLALVSSDPIVEKIGGKPIAGILGVSVLGNWDQANFAFAQDKLTLYDEGEGSNSAIGIAIVGALALLLVAMGVVVFWRRRSRPTA